MSVFTGAGVAIVTPMNQDGSVNYKEFAELIEFQIAGGTDAIIVCGTTGEASTLGHEEHLEVVKYCVEVVNKRIPVIAGTGSNCTDTAIYLSKEAESYGVDGLLLVSPYYNKATQNGLYTHFKAVADAVKVPIILYNIPGRTGVNINPATGERVSLKEILTDTNNLSFLIEQKIKEKYEEYFTPAQEPQEPKNTPQFSKQPGHPGTNPESDEDKLVKQLSAQW